MFFKGFKKKNVLVMGRNRIIFWKGSFRQTLKQKRCFQFWPFYFLFFFKKKRIFCGGGGGAGFHLFLLGKLKIETVFFLYLRRASWAEESKRRRALAMRMLAGGGKKKKQGTGGVCGGELLPPEDISIRFSFWRGRWLFEGCVWKMDQLTVN